MEANEVIHLPVFCRPCRGSVVWESKNPQLALWAIFVRSLRSF